MQRSNEQLVTIARTIVGILWRHGPLGAWGVAVEEMEDAMVSATSFF